MYSNVQTLCDVTIIGEPNVTNKEREDDTIRRVINLLATMYILRTDSEG